MAAQIARPVFNSIFVVHILVWKGGVLHIYMRVVWGLTQHCRADREKINFMDHKSTRDSIYTSVKSGLYHCIVFQLMHRRANVFRSFFQNCGTRQLN